MSEWDRMMNARVYEPTPRLHDWHGHHGHRFPINGGITRRDAWARNLTLNLTRGNPLFRRLAGKAS